MNSNLSFTFDLNYFLWKLKKQETRGKFLAWNQAKRFLDLEI